MRDYWRWVWANTWAVFVAFSVGFLIPELDDATLREAVLESAVTIAVEGPILGVIVGWAQGRVIRRLVPRVTLARWIKLTVAGAVLLMIASLVTSRVGIMSTTIPEDAGLVAILAAGIPYALVAAGTGLPLGALFAWPQSRALTGSLVRPWRWIVVNALGWAAGLAILTFLVSITPLTGGFRLAPFAILAGFACLGASVGAASGSVLARIIAI